MNVDEQPQRAHLRNEARAIEAMLKQGKPVLGICLGAQLLAHVLGAPVPRNRVPEIGWYPLHKTDAGNADPVLAPLAATTPVFQWHGCRFDIPLRRKRLRLPVPSGNGRAPDRALAEKPGLPR